MAALLCLSVCFRGLVCSDCVIVVFTDHTHLIFVHTGCNNSDRSDRLSRLTRVYAGRI